MAWLVRDGAVLATVEVASTGRARRRGLLGRDGIEGALLLQPVRSVHTFGMRFTIDVALLDRELRVRRTLTLSPGRLTRPSWGVRAVLEAEAGAFASWGLVPGDVLEVREGAAGRAP